MAKLHLIQDCIDQLAALIQEIEAMPEVTAIQNMLRTVIPGLTGNPLANTVMPDLIGHPTIPASTGPRAKREIATVREAYLPGLSIFADQTGNPSDRHARPDRASRPICANALFIL